MKSMTVVKSGIGRSLAALALVAAAMVVPAKAGVIASGTVPLENYFIARGVEGINLGAAGAAAVIASLWITNNAPNAFTLTITQRNGGFLRQGLAAALPVTGVAATTAGTGVPFTAACNMVDGASGTWGRVAAFAPVAFAAPGPGVIGTYASSAAAVATTDFKLNIDATWTADNTLLAGVYTEVFTISLVAVM